MEPDRLGIFRRPGLRIQRRLHAVREDEGRATAHPRSAGLSLEERYGTLEGYVCVVERAAEQAVSERFLLKEDADRLIGQARSSGVLPADAESSPQNRATAQQICGRTVH